jgi:hypothetical protein
MPNGSTFANLFRINANRRRNSALRAKLAGRWEESFDDLRRTVRKFASLYELANKVELIASSLISGRWLAPAGRTSGSQGWSRLVWIPVLARAMIFARRVLAMMSFSIFKARL